MATTALEHALFQASPGWLTASVDALLAAGIEVIAPVESDTGRVTLEPVAAGGDITLKYLNAVLPLKRVFFPETEVLLEFDNKPDGDVDLRTPPAGSDGPRVVMGCRPCDAAALDALDQVFQWDYDDVPYRAQRERTTVVTFACTEPDGHCFCTSVGGSPQDERGSDALVFIGDDGAALIKVLTDKGQALMDRLGGTVQPADESAAQPEPPAIEPKFSPDQVRAWLDDNFDHDFWKTATLNCVGCGACSYLCPTCHCFDIVDEAVWNHGERRRNWDCCSFGLFTLHASGHNPRSDQGARYRQRVMHKFKYFPERFDRIACVGCGRCVRTCGAGQSLVRTLNAIETLQAAGE